jgi:periplasmic divalent cation tolerance protein
MKDPEINAEHDGELVVFCTCANEEESLRLAQAIVAERLAACVNIVPSIRSIYRWEGKVETSEELLLVIKTVRERLPALESKISELHSYDTPEIIAIRVAGGSEKYLSWLREGCKL